MKLIIRLLAYQQGCHAALPDLIKILAVIEPCQCRGGLNSVWNPWLRELDPLL